MSLLDLKAILPVRRRTSTPNEDAVPLPRTAETADSAGRLDSTTGPLYLIAHVTGTGWTLLAERGAGLGFQATALAAHGAAMDAPARVAQAVAVRTLAQQGVTVAGWTDWPTLSSGRAAVDGGPGTTMFRARLS